MPSARSSLPIISTETRFVPTASQWNRFTTLRNRHWYLLDERGPPLVLMGDAAHTAHFSIGSGTKLAMEDAAGLYQALQASPESIGSALASYEAERQPPVARFQEAAWTAPDISSPSAIICNWNRRRSRSIS